MITQHEKDIAAITKSAKTILASLTEMTVKFTALVDAINKLESKVFIEELNRPVELVGEYEVTVIAGPPSDADLMVATLVEKMDLKPSQPTSGELVDDQDPRFTKAAAWLIENEKTGVDLVALMNARGIRFQEKAFDHLLNIIWYRSELVKGPDGCFSLRDILSANDTLPAEVPQWEALAAKIDAR